MAVYRFRYADASGAAIRTTHMQCGADSEAIGKAHDTMHDRYATVEIFEGERLVHGAFPLPGAPQPAKTRQSAQV
jgi:hypothetical protein